MQLRDRAELRKTDRHEHALTSSLQMSFALFAAAGEMLKDVKPWGCSSGSPVGAMTYGDFVWKAN